jgi:hypothetical protein
MQTIDEHEQTDLRQEIIQWKLTGVQWPCVWRHCFVSAIDSMKNTSCLSVPSRNQTKDTNIMNRTDELQFVDHVRYSSGYLLLTQIELKLDCSSYTQCHRDDIGICCQHVCCICRHSRCCTNSCFMSICSTIDVDCSHVSYCSTRTLFIVMIFCLI